MRILRAWDIYKLLHWRRVKGARFWGLHRRKWFIGVMHVEKEE